MQKHLLKQGEEKHNRAQERGRKGPGRKKGSLTKVRFLRGVSEIRESGGHTREKVRETKRRDKQNKDRERKKKRNRKSLRSRRDLLFSKIDRKGFAGEWNEWVKKKNR